MRALLFTILALVIADTTLLGFIAWRLRRRLHTIEETVLDIEQYARALRNAMNLTSDHTPEGGEE